jgi:hypothetical protein
VDFKLENVLVSLHSLKTMGLGPFGASAPLSLRNGELLGHSPLVKSRLKIDYWFILCFGLLPLVLKKINNSSKLFYTLGLLRNSAIDENNFL